MKDEAARLLFEKDALHIYAGVAIQIVIAALSGRTLGNRLPWLMVLGFEGVNEALDIMRGGEPALRPWQIVSAVHDLVNTMMLPTVLLLLCRYRPGLFSSNERPRAIATEADAARD